MSATCRPTVLGVSDQLMTLKYTTFKILFNGISYYAVHSITIKIRVVTVSCRVDYSEWFSLSYSTLKNNRIG